MPLILVSNDDGIDSKGVHLLAESLKKIGDVVMVVPDRERSAASHALTLHKPLRIEEIREKVYTINGTPTDCINLGVNHILSQRPDLVVSGINRGGNLGDDVTYSGTVSAAFEGTLLRVPSFAVSLVSEGPFDFSAAARVAASLAERVLLEGLPTGVLLNVNVPAGPWSELHGIRITRQGRRIYDANTITEKVDPRGRKYYWIGGNRLSWEEDEGSDFEAIEQRWISVTPLRLDLTDDAARDLLRSWEGSLDTPLPDLP